MYFKHTICLYLLALCCSSCLWQQTQAYCSLDKMKKYAMEACEHLFMQEEGREKRATGYEQNLIETVGFGKYYEKRHIISRSIYPPGGYLKVGHEHFRKLSQVNVIPKYKPKKLHHDKKQRYKREQADNYKNIPYCCYNRCEEDFFC